MTRPQAIEIADLLNRRNELAQDYDAEKVLRNAQEWEVALEDDHVAACVQRRRVQWYQWEICHLSVDDGWEGRGLGFKLYKQAVAAARAGGARVLQCTIRSGNKRSELFFARQGFTRTTEFYNSATGNNVATWQKALCPPLDPRDGETH
jgi:ribosomal protein S18 acetylase RimI-like enzyme